MGRGACETAQQGAASPQVLPAGLAAGDGFDFDDAEALDIVEGPHAGLEEVEDEV